MTECPTDDALAAFCGGTLSSADCERIQTHIDTCQLCHTLIGELVRARGPASTGPREPRREVFARPGAVIDGFVLRARLGAGAMGDVWLADEPALERRVAIKLLRPDLSAPDASELLQREARALAQQSHPNVVAVHRVGRAQDRDYIAMEFVGGATLAEWIGDARPSVSERVGAMIQAGRGLAAAHKAGVIHRDFKPSNVFMGDDGRVRVGDFGLARAPAASADASAPTRTALAGTPVYMSPEQLRGERASEASDQYAFAVSLYEVVYGVRPFAASTERDLEQAIARGPLRRPSHRTRVPRWLRAATLRGLSDDPTKRFASMDAMVDALEAGRKQAKRVVYGAAIIGAAVVSAAVAIPLAAHEGPRCESSASGLADVWNAGRAGTIRARLLDIAGDSGAAQWQLAAAGFDRYARDWTSMRVDTCEATHVRRTQSARLFDRRMYCLDRRRSQLDAVLTSLAAAQTPEAAARAAEIAANLPSLAACSDTEWLSEYPMPPVEQRAAIDAAFAALDEARALGLAGRYQDGLAACTALEPSVRALDYPPLSSDLAFETARSADQVGDDQRARAEYERASVLAGQLGRPDRVFEAQRRLVRMIAFHKEYDEALARAAVVESLAHLTGEADGIARHHENVGAIHAFRGDQKAALAARELALAALPASALGTEVEATIRQGRGISLMRLGDRDAAGPELERALALYRELYGPNHPLASNALLNLGNLAWFRGDKRAALSAYEEAMAVQEFVGGGCDADCAITVGNVALGQHAVGQLEQAVETFGRAIALRTKYLGADHPEVALALSNQGNALRDLGRFDEAEAAIVQSLAIRARADAPKHSDLVRGYLSLGAVRLARDTPQGSASALEPLATAIAIGTDSMGADHPLVGWGNVQRARALLALGRVEEARRAAEAGAATLTAALGAEDEDAIRGTTVLALVMLRSSRYDRVAALLIPVVPTGALPPARAESAFALARAWWAQGRQADALVLAERAAAALGDDVAAVDAALATRIAAWLAAHRSS